MARILIVDDDSSIRALLREILEEEGYQVEEAVDGKQGVLCYRENPADLVITDILMPEKDGVELIMELQESFPEIKIVAMSGGGRGLDAQFNLRIAKDFGAVQQMEKPFTRKHVLETVRRAL
ncbi:MAG: response regulator [Magnetococcales bacterium]|nr:response regulator [Magnetococcales bacterium]